jgi:hypothetical protein
MDNSPRIYRLRRPFSVRRRQAAQSVHDSNRVGQFSAMDTIGRKLDNNRGVGPGFDFLRITLAVSVICWHSPSITAGKYTFDDAP